MTTERNFADHARIDAELGSTGYFADLFASWQCGSNENFNGLLRQYIPKKRPLSTVTHEEPKMIEEKLNFAREKDWDLKHRIRCFMNP